jgi:hypothetical protein
MMARSRQGFSRHARFRPDIKEHRSLREAAPGLRRDLFALPSAGARLRPTHRTALRVHSIRGFLIFPLHAMRRVDCRRCEVVVVERRRGVKANAV